MSFVSVIIPNHNGAKYLVKTLDSCIQQKEFVKEIIVVDDYSTDESWALLSRYEKEKPGLVKLLKSPYKGGNPARNFGFARSSGKFIQWLDADDILLPGKLKAQVDYLERNDQIDIAYSDWQLDTYDGDRLVRSECKKGKGYDDYLYQLLIDNWLPPNAYLLKRPIAQAAFDNLWWNPSTPVAQDREYFTRCAIGGARFGYAEGNFCIYNRFLQVSSVSRVMEPAQKAQNLILLLHSFEKELAKQGWIGASRQEDYRSVIQTQLIYHAAINNLPLTASISLRAIKWSWISGWRSRLMVFMKWLRV